MEKRELLTAGYSCYTGHIMTQNECNSYNRLQERINKFIEEGRNVPEYLLNASRVLFHTIATQSQPRQK